MEFKNFVFNIGEHVFLNDGDYIYTIELYKSYKIIETRFNVKGEQLIAFNDGYDIFYNSKRFTKDIRPIRKMKLKKLYKIK